MSPEIRNMLIMFGAIAIALILIIITFGGDNPLQRFISLFIEETGDDDSTESKYFSSPVIEMATLIRKSDDRLRIIESDGNIKLIDEYYELTFINRKGQTVKIECSADAYEKIPFNQEGSLTYRKNKLIKFKYYEDTVYDSK